MDTLGIIKSRRKDGNPCGGKQGMKVVRRSIPFHYIIIWEESQWHGKAILGLRPALGLSDSGPMDHGRAGA